MSDRGAASQGDETRLRLEVQRLRQELDALHETTTDLAADERRGDLVSTIVARAAGLVEGAEGFLFLIDDEGTMRLAVATGAAGALGAISVDPGAGSSARCGQKPSRSRSTTTSPGRDDLSTPAGSRSRRWLRRRSTEPTT